MKQLETVTVDQLEKEERDKLKPLFYEPREFKKLRVQNLQEGDPVLIFNDTQIPFIDHKAVNAMLRFADDLKPKLIFLMGDILDFYGCSNFDPNPSRVFTLQDEIDEAVAFLKSLKTRFPQARLFFCDGNHEDRLRRFLWGEGAKLASLKVLRTAKLLEFAELGITGIPYRSHFDLAGFIMEHGYRASKSAAFPANVARLMAIERGTSGLCGHDHRHQVYSWTDERGTHLWVNNGCLCLRDLEYAPNPNWQVAFSFAYIFGGRAFVTPVKLQRGGFVANGKLYAV